MWEAVLVSLRSEDSPGEADRRLQVLLDSTGAPPPPPLQVILAEWRGPGLRRYRAPWVRRMVQEHLVEDACEGAGECGADALTSFVRLGDPIITDDSATVTVTDVTEIPSQCRGDTGGGFVGFHQRTLKLMRNEEKWRVVASEMGMTGSGFCGKPDTASVRIGRENERLRRRRSPIAGTWRYVVTLPEGDSLVVHSRTSLHPMSVLRERTMAEIQDDEERRAHPIVGYYLDANCAFAPDQVDHDGPQSMGSCYHAVSLDPVFRSRDSTVWRGESEAELAAWILLDSIPLKSRLRDALGSDEDRDPAWYFMPGYWIQDRAGRIHYRLDIVHEGKVLLRIRGERISEETLPPD